MTTRNETLGPAERIIQTLTTHVDHLYHHRPGIVTQAPGSPLGVAWSPATTRKQEDGTCIVQRLPERKSGKREVVGVLGEDGKIRNDAGVIVGEFRGAGIFPEVAVWAWRQIVEIWKTDNEFAARWASFTFHQDRRDLKILLGAFMLVQDRCGKILTDENDDEVLFDEDFRDVGEAIVLDMSKSSINAKMLLRMREILEVPGVAKLNHDLDFGDSERRPFLGRWRRAVTKWLKYRDENPHLLKGLVRAGFKTTVRRLASAVGYKPTSPAFFQILGWKQTQADDGRRTIAIGEEIQKDSWEGLKEAQICKKIVGDKPSWKVIVGKVTTITPAIVMAALEVGSISDTDLIILQPTIEELGLAEDKMVRKRLKAALEKANDARARNIAKNVRSKALKDELEAAADKAIQAKVEEASRDLRVYVMIDVSGSMEKALEEAKPMIAAIIQSIPLERMHVSIFNTVGREVAIKEATTKGVEKAFKGIRAQGGTSYAEGVRALSKYKPQSGEDVLFIFIGDEEDGGALADSIRQSGLNPMAFGLLKVKGLFGGHGSIVRTAATNLGIPCFNIDAEMFKDPYAVPRILADLMKSTPVNRAVQAAPRRQSLIEIILDTPILQKPVWAA